MPGFQFAVDPDKGFKKVIAQALDEVGDLTIPFQLITQSWFKGNRAIFALKGKGKYFDLSPAYKEEKNEAVGFVYPILRRSGLLEKTLTQAGHPGSVNVIVNKSLLLLGVKDQAVPYAKFHQEGTEKMPRRPFIFLGAEQTAPDELNRRRESWIALVVDFVEQRTKKTFGGA